MDEDYDVIVLGTGLKECILSGMLSVSGKKVLHMDRNDYYGADSTSLTPLQELFKHFGMGDSNTGAQYGNARDWNVDLIPKFLMAGGQLVKLLLFTGVTRYIEFKEIEGSFVQADKKIYRVPATAKEALATSLMGIFEKRRFTKFISFVNSFDETKPATWDGTDPNKTSAAELYAKFGLDANTQSFTGHAFALYQEDSYLEKPYLEFVNRIRLYAESLMRFGKSPYIYPLYGLGELPQGFARLSAVYGGTYMLNTPIEEILYDEQGCVKGVRSKDGVARCKTIICDPSYAPEKCETFGKVVRAICLLNHPVANTNDSGSCQIIIPQLVTKRHNDIFIAVMSKTNCVTANGWWVAIASTTVETANPDEELRPALNLLGSIDQKFITTTELRRSTHDENASRLYVSTSYDATSHFETTCKDVLAMFEKITGEPFDFSKVKATLDDEQQ